VFFPEGAFGPTNNCVGIGDVLRRRGHRVVFVAEQSFAGTLEAKGFEERLMRLSDAPEFPEAPGQFWKDFIRDTAPVFRADTQAQLAGFILPTWQALVDGARFVDERLTEIFDELSPDAIVEDNVCSFPAIPASGRPWVRIVSCNPLEITDPDLPPTFSGLALEDRTNWEAFRAEYAGQVGDLQASFSEFCVERGAPPLPAMQMIHESPWLNLYLYPSELDYPRSVALGRTWHNVHTCVRATDDPWSPPQDEDGRRLVYLSLGSLGSADLELMQRLVELLADTPHRYIVSRGPRHREYELAENMIGEEFLPQTSVLPHVDAVITHGGNNTVTECMWFGKPMLVLPIFWDQHDNAQRVHETGYGLRLPTYALSRDELAGAVDRLLTDGELRGRVRAAGERLRQTPGTEAAADLIERVAVSGEPVEIAVAG
jgi:MGT family glycosyltransferase